MKFPLILPSLVLALSTPAHAIFGLFEDDTPVEAPAPATRESQERLAAVQLQRAATALQRGDNREAKRAYSDIVELYPFTTAAGQAQYQLGQVAELSGDHDKAIVAYQRVITRYSSSGRFTDALQREFTLAQAAKRGEIKTSFLGIARNYDRSDVISWYNNVITAAPRSNFAAPSLLAVGEMQSEMGNRQASVDALQRLVREYPDSPQAPGAQLMLSQVIVEVRAG